jgi:endonuclease YncB( thermonuclease family)
MGIAFGAVVSVGSMAAYESIKPGFQPIASSDVFVVDGDTIRISGSSQSVRLVGFNTPEKVEPQCDLERGLGVAASDRLLGIVASGNLDFAYVRCACWPGTAGTEKCNFGRACGTLRAGGKDVGNLLIDESLAVPFKCGWTSCPPTPRPWCGEVAAIAPLIGGESSSPANCDIKGNISAKGERIYHVPGQKYYERTIITEGKGERWFCTEADAQAAGWRKAFR